MSPGPEDSEGSIQLEEGDEDLDDFDIAGSGELQKCLKNTTNLKIIF